MLKVYNLSGALKRFVTIGIFLIVICSGINAEEEARACKLFTVDELQADFQQMQELLEKGHSILYKFTDKSAFDQFVESHWIHRGDKSEIICRSGGWFPRRPGNFT